MSNANVAAEFGGRASIFYDWFNSVPYGDDCSGNSHGTMVTSIAGGNTLGTGRGATLKIVKLTNWGASGSTCGTDPGVDVFLGSLNWLATPGNAPRGSIVNISFGFSSSSCAPSLNPDIDAAIKGMHDNAGLIVVVAAGNDGCNVADFAMTRLPEAFVVGGTSNSGLYLSSGRYDALYSVPPNSTNTGSNVSTFAPAQNVRGMDRNGGTPSLFSGTSLAAPYMAGVFAVACQAAGTYCDTTPIATLYNDLRNTGTLGTVKNADGSTPLPNNSTSRFIWQQW